MSRRWPGAPQGHPMWPGGGHTPFPCGPRWLLSGSSSFYYYFYIFQNNSPNILVQFLALLFLHKNNTMVVLLKTASVRVSFIQIMQIRVQNKRKSIRKSRYDEDVSTPPSLSLCLSSSNSVDKLKVKKENFYELFFCYLHK